MFNLPSTLQSLQTSHEKLNTFHTNLAAPSLAATKQFQNLLEGKAGAHSENNIGQTNQLFSSGSFNALGAFAGSLVGGILDTQVTPVFNQGNTDITADKAKEFLPYLDLSAAAYGDDALPSGWEQLDINNIGGIPLQDINTGLNASVYQNHDTGEVSIAFRGSESPLPFINDWIEDGKQVQGQHSPQAQQAQMLGAAAKNIYGENLTFTGHSLGGVLAQTAGIEAGSKVYAFDSAGLDQGTLTALGEKVEQNQQLVDNVSLKGEFVTDLDGHQDGDASHTGRLLGNVYYADDAGFQPFFLLDNPITRHFTPGLRDSLAETAGQVDTTNDTLDVLNFLGNYLTAGLR